MALLLVGLFRFSTLGLYPVFDSTEARYAEIPREMVATNNWIMPQLDPGVPFWGKPPLAFWLTAIAYKVAGVSEFTARAPHLMVSILSVLLALKVGSRLYGRRFGLLAALILATTALFHVLAAGVMTDPTLATSVTISLSGFILAMVEPRAGWRRSAYGYAFFVGLALAMLAKGPVGVALILAPVVAWVAATKSWSRAVAQLPWLGGPLVSLALAAPWYVLAERQTPGFLDYFIVGEHIRRFLVPGWEGDLYGNPHVEPLGAIWLFGLIASLPWGIYVAVALFQMRRSGQSLLAFFRDPCHLFFLFWFLSPLVLFALARNVIITYMLPGLPGMALLFARVLQVSQEKKGASPLGRLTSRPAWQWPFVIVAPLCFFIAAVAILPTVGLRRSQKKLVTSFYELRPGPSSRFLYFEDMPNSADFYSRGAAEVIPQSAKAKWTAITSDSTQDYIVVEGKDEDNLFWTTGKTFRVLVRHGKYLLLTEKPRSVSSNGPLSRLPPS